MLLLHTVFVPALGPGSLAAASSNRLRRASSLSATCSGESTLGRSRRGMRRPLRLQAAKSSNVAHSPEPGAPSGVDWLGAIAESEELFLDDGEYEDDTPRACGPKSGYNTEVVPETAYLVGFERKGERCVTHAAPQCFVCCVCSGQWQNETPNVWRVCRDRLFELDDSLDELQRLAETAGLDVLGRTSQRLIAMDARTLVGSGKVAEILQDCAALKIDTIIFDCELTPRQGRCAPSHRAWTSLPLPLFHLASARACLHRLSTGATKSQTA